MASNITVWGEWAFAQLLNGPMEREKLRAGMKPLIPPGVAFRFTENDRAYKRRKHVPISTKRQPKRDTPEHVTIEIGRNRVAGAAISAAISNGHYMAYEMKGVQYVALGPRAAIGPVQRLARVRCRQSHNWWNGEGEYNPCPIWHEHIREAIELWDAGAAPSHKKFYKTRSLNADLEHHD